MAELSDTPAPRGRWVRSYENGIEYLEHLDGVEWAEARRPRWWHRCSVQTRGFFDLTKVERCACGAARLYDRFGAGPWLERNSRRAEERERSHDL